MSSSLEMLFEIWNDDHGGRLEVGEDRDGLGLIELRQKAPTGEVEGRVTLTSEELPMLIEAMEALRAWMTRDEFGGGKSG